MDDPLIELDEEQRAEDAWCEAERARVAQYMSAMQVSHSAIGDWPAWHVAPYVAVWAIESDARPGWIGWWAISGDVPLDYISAASIPAPQHPRKALSAIAERWRATADASLKSPASVQSPLTPELAEQLESRAALLLDCSADDALWDVE